ncbi:MAG: arsenate reductase ArsC, partial [Candidatus Tectomicrobia bacterium]|nr:arsenate reductase ArsC [Candidatus Tectomicrobia bacterium]
MPAGKPPAFRSLVLYRSPKENRQEHKCYPPLTRRQPNRNTNRGKFTEKRYSWRAGTEPADFVHPLAVQIMKEIGIDISEQRSKPLDMGLAQTMDAIITVCDDAEERCPMIPGVRRFHLPILDPLEGSGTWEEVLNRFRAVRDNMSWRINEIIKEIKLIPIYQLMVY